jgi:hypothetical protein
MSFFLLSDIVIHTTVMRGISTAGYQVTGTVRRILPGLCFEVDAGPRTQRSFLWRELEVIPDATPHPAEKKHSVEISMDGIVSRIPIPTLRRTDSGADYGTDGFPDVEFWHRQGIQTVFLATEYDYNLFRFPPSPLEMRDRLIEVKPVADEKGGRFLEAWIRQMKQIEQMMFVPRADALGVINNI